VLAAVAAAAALSAVSISSDQSRMTSTKTVAAHTPGTQGSVVVRDPETGALRDATPEELLQLQGNRLQAAEAPEPIVSATGLSGLKLGDDQMTFTVATRNADGTVSVEHAAGTRDAKRLVQTGEQGGIIAGKERLLER
jgi:hypothetical protein